MKSKFLPALLLSIVVVAGTTTITDAFAQTNTEKLTNIVSTTDDTNSVVKMIQEALSSLMASIDALTGSVDQLSSDVSSSNAEITSKLNDIEAAMAAGASLAIAISGLADEIDAVKDAVEHVDEHIESMGDTSDLQATVDDLSTSTNARLNTLEENMNQKLDALQTQLSSISENLGVVQETVAPDPSATAIPSLMNEVENNVIKASFYAKQFAASNNENAIGLWPKDADAFGLKYDFTFSCDGPVLVDTVSVEAAGPMDDDTDTTGTDLTAAAAYGHPLLVRTHGEALTGDNANDAATYTVAADGTVGGTNGIADPATTITVNGRTLVDTNFDTGSTNVPYRQPANFELMHLNPGQTLNFKTEVNFRAYTVATQSLPINNSANEIENNDVPYYPRMGTHNPSEDVATTPASLRDTYNVYANLTEGDTAELEKYDFDIFEVNVDYISLSGSNAECALSLPDDPTTYPNTDLVLVNLVATGDGLIKNFEAMVNCNDQPTRIVGSDLTVDYSDALSGSLTAAFNLKIESGGKSMSFDLTPAGDLDRTDGPAALTFDSGNIVISGQVPQVSGVLLGLAYETSRGNTCSVVTQ